MARRMLSKLIRGSLLAMLLAQPAIALAQGSPPTDKLQLADVGYNDDTLLGRGFTSDYFLPGPGEYDLAATGSVLDLVYSSTSLAGPDSAMTISWNGVPVGDVSLAHKEQRQHVTIPLPTDRIDPSVNRIDVRGSLDLQENVCREDSPADHVTIYRETAVQYALADGKPRPTPVTPDLARYPAPFFDSVPGTVTNLTLLLPDKPSGDVLRATAAITSGLGRVAGSRPLKFNVATDSGSLPDDLAQTNAIYIGAAKDLPGLRHIPNMPLAIDASGSIAKDGAAIGEEDGVLMEAPSPLNSGRMILAVTGQTGVAVVKAASVLSASGTARLLGGSSAIIDRIDMPTSSAQAPSGRHVVTLADLGRSDETLNGIGDHSITFKVELPGVPQGNNGLTLNLVSSHSPLLDAASSSVRVTVNNVPLNSIGLKDKSQTRDVTQVKLPPSALRSGVNTFEITFTLRLVVAQTTQVCQPVPSEQAWAVLHSTTSLELPTQFGSSSGADLAGYPYPFVAATGIEKTAFVVPDQFALEPFVRYCADLGRSLTHDSVPPLVIPASEFQPASLDANLIIWGTPAQNPVLAQLSQNLPLAITPGTPQIYAFASNMLLSVRDSSNLGVIQELASPWHANRRILVLSGTTPDALALAVTGLSQPGLANNLALVSPAPPPTVTTITPIGSPPAVQLTTYKIVSGKQVTNQRSTIEILPVVLAAALGLLAMVMAASMAYQAFVREPKNRR